MLKNMVENGGKQQKKSVSQAAREAGYSEAYIKSGKLQKTKAWQQLIDQELPDEELMTINKELLHHPDWRARKEGLHLAYRIKKKYDRELNIRHEISTRSIEEIDDEIAEIIGETLELITEE